MKQDFDDGNRMDKAGVKRILNAILFISFLFGYLEWGKGNSMFIFQGEAEVLSKAVKEPASVLHPLILLPFIGQALILYTIFQKNPSRIFSLIGLACLGLLMSFLFFIGLLSPNIRMLLSSVPFVITAVLVLKYNWKK